MGQDKKRRGPTSHSRRQVRPWFIFYMLTYLKRSAFNGSFFSYRWWRQRSCAFPGSGWGGAKPVGSSQWSSPAQCYAFGCRFPSLSASSSDSDRGSLSLAPCGWHTAPIWSENKQVHQGLDKHPSRGKKKKNLEISQLIQQSGVISAAVYLKLWWSCRLGADDVAWLMVPIIKGLRRETKTGHAASK